MAQKVPVRPMPAHAEGLGFKDLGFKQPAQDDVDGAEGARPTDACATRGKP